ncbi:MarR family winged helix-turn-helix transcriptional regulator [Arthrobacter sp. TMS1-12-1]
MDDDRGLTAQELDQILTWSIVRVARFMGQRLSERLAAQGLNPIHFGVLAYLAIAPEMTQADLARSVLVRPQSIAPLLDGLEERGLIRRTGDRTRGRRNPVKITDSGRGALTTVWDIALTTNDLSDAGLTGMESTELNRLLLKIIHNTSSTKLDGFYG